MGSTGNKEKVSGVRRVVLGRAQEYLVFRIVVRTSWYCDGRVGESDMLPNDKYPNGEYTIHGGESVQTSPVIWSKRSSGLIAGFLIFFTTWV